MNIVQRHPYIALGLVAVLVSIVHTMDYEHQLRQERMGAVRYIEREPTGCRTPDPGTEQRITIETQDQSGRLISRCSIEPLDPEERPRDTMRRLLQRERTSI